MTANNRIEYADGNVIIRMGHEKLTIFKYYQVASICNDFLIALWFLAGSIIKLDPQMETLSIWLFIIGSAQFLLRPCIRLAHHFQLRAMPDSEWEM